MENVVTGIASLETKEVNTKRGPGQLYVVSDVLGIEYSTFDRDLAVSAAALKGKTALIGFDEVVNTKPNRDGVNVTYTNRYLKSVANSAEDIGPTDVLGSASESRGSETLAAVAQQVEPVLRAVYDKDASIARAVALKAAVEVVASGVITGLVNVSDVLEVAKAFEPYLLGYDAPTETSVANDVEDLPF